jgi:hypothetical protein
VGNTSLFAGWYNNCHGRAIEALLKAPASWGEIDARKPE